MPIISRTSVRFWWNRSKQCFLDASKHQHVLHITAWREFFFFLLAVWWATKYIIYIIWRYGLGLSTRFSLALRRVHQTFKELSRDVLSSLKSAWTSCTSHITLNQSYFQVQFSLLSLLFFDFVIVNGNFIFEYETRRNLMNNKYNTLEKSWNDAIL